VLSFVTGWVCFATDRPPGATLASVTHGVLGVAVVVLIPWKSMIVRRSRRVWIASVALAVLVLSCLLAGFAQFFLGYSFLLGVSPIQIHVGAACGATALLGWHVLHHRRQRLRRSDFSRRALLRGAGLVAGAGLCYGLLAAVAPWTRGPGGRAAGTGSRRMDPDAIPATIWLLDPVPQLDAVGFRVDVDGRSLGPAELADGAEDVRARLDCTSGWYADAVWSGKRLADLIAPSRLVSAASLRVTSVTGYSRSFPATEASRLWLAVACQGRTLSAAGGGPVRLVATGRRGFWWVKWVARVELTAAPSWRQLPFPVQ
jgi:hypothetical protein